MGSTLSNKSGRHRQISERVRHIFRATSTDSAAPVSGPALRTFTSATRRILCVCVPTGLSLACLYFHRHQLGSLRGVLKRGGQERPPLDDPSLAALLTTHPMANIQTIRDQSPLGRTARTSSLRFRASNCAVLTKFRPPPTTGRSLRRKPALWSNLDETRSALHRLMWLICKSHSRRPSALPEGV